jgi:hypothetical protein
VQGGVRFVMRMCRGSRVVTSLSCHLISSSNCHVGFSDSTNENIMSLQ